MCRIFLTSIVFFICICPTWALGQQARVGTWKTAQTLQPFFYDQFLESIEVQVFSFTNPGDQKAALLAGSLDMTGTTLPMAIEAASRGEPIVLVAALCHKCSALVARKNAGISSVSDLRQRTIGYIPGTMHEVLLRDTLTQAQLDPDHDVRLMRVDFFDMGLALAKGDIDAFLSGEPLPTQAVEDGYGQIIAYPYFDHHVGTINAGLIVHRDVLEKEPTKIAALVQAHVQATKKLKTDQDFWLEEAALHLGLERQTLEQAAPNMELAWDMDQIFIQQLKNLGQKLFDLGIIEVQPDYDSLVFTDFLEQIKTQEH